jgi:hypothetical protein
VQLTWRQRLASALLMAASVLLPGGFFVGGTFMYDGDPGLGILLAPPGAFCLFLGVFLTAIDLVRGKGSMGEPPRAGEHGG